MVCGSNKLWAGIVRARYGIHYVVDLWAASTRHHSPIWSGTLKVCGRGTSQFSFWVRHMRVQIGNGETLRFWWDLWHGTRPLAITHRSLYNVSASHSLTLAAFGDHQVGWVCDLYEWEQSSVDELWASFNQLWFTSNMDGYVWDLEDTGMFTINSCSKGLFMLRENLQQNELLQSCWSKIIPFRIALFSWLALQAALSTRDYLHRHHVIPDTNLRCVLC